MPRAKKLSIGMTIVVASLLGTLAPAPAFAEAGAAPPAVVTEQPGAGAPATDTPEAPTPDAAEAPDTADITVVEDAPPADEAPTPAEAPPAATDTLAPEAEQPGAAAEAPAARQAQAQAADESAPQPPTFTRTGASGNAAYFNWRYAEGDPQTSGGVRVTVWDAEVGGTPVDTCSVGVPQTFCTVSGLTLYREYWVSAQRWLPGDVNSEPTARVMVKPRLVPGTPQNVTARIVGNSIEVSWDRVADPIDAPVTQYEVFVGKSNGAGHSGYLVRAGATASSLSVDVSGPGYVDLHGEIPTIFVQAVNEVGTGANSPSLTLTERLPATGLFFAFGTPVPTADGFTVEMTNYDPTFQYSAVSPTGTVAVSGKTITVSGLTPGDTTVATVTATKAGHFSTSAQAWGVAGFAQAPASLTTPVSTADGFTTRITNFDDRFTYALAVANGASSVRVSRDGDVITVSGMAPGTSETVSVRTSRDGWRSATTEVSGFSLRAATGAPTFSAPQGTADGFTVQILNWDPQVSYRLEVLGDATAALQAGVLTVTGLAANRYAAVDVFSTRAGEAEGRATVVGRSNLHPPIRFALGAVSPTADGWTAPIVDYDTLADGNTSFMLMTTDGTGTITDDGVVIVRGLAPGQAASVTVTLLRADTTLSTADARGTALAAHTVTFDADGGEPATSTAAVRHGGTVSEPAQPTRERHAFTGWFTDPDLRVAYDFDASVTADLTLYAGWRVSAYAVTWDENWPGAGDPVTSVVSGDTVGVLPDPSAAGWVITGWNTEPDGSGAAVLPYTSLASVASGADVTLYAQWERRTLSLAVPDPVVASGSDVVVTATANAAFGGTVDASADVEITSSIPSDTVTGNTVRVTAAGARTLTGTFDGATATAELEVVAGPLASLSITASAATVARGGSLEFAVTGADASGNPVVLDPSDVTLTSDVATDVVDGLTVTFPTASPHTITATVGDVVASVLVEVQDDTAVEPGAPKPPTEPPTERGGQATPPTAGDAAAKLPETGNGPATGAAAAGAMLLLAGAILLGVQRRRSGLGGDRATR
ncbi:InlB B-repeat-containing protein [Leucobacter chromiireducens]|uniref:InlB B-repeat-containing protein n=1 Tax=Leucobacter chromiireducens TaxID=283877 RepID=UPI000F636DA3|nr:InlB B-repeat-containing protein [Leucobacter chromiireducens]